jgi:hypothetical protein
VKRTVVILVLSLVGCAVDTLEGTFNGYRTLKNGVKVALVGGSFCPLDAVDITPSIELGDNVLVQWKSCKSTIAEFDR